MAQMGHKDQKPNSILYTHTSYHASGNLKETTLCHTRHENAHTSKIEWSMSWCDKPQPGGGMHLLKPRG